MDSEDLKKALALAAAPFVLCALFIAFAIGPQLLGGKPLFEGPMAYSSFQFLEIGACFCALGLLAIPAALVFLIYKEAAGARPRKEKAPEKPGRRSRTEQFKKPPPK